MDNYKQAVTTIIAMTIAVFLGTTLWSMHQEYINARKTQSQPQPPIQ
jgi:hypothetical protein